MDVQGPLFAQIVVRQLREKPGDRIVMVVPSAERAEVLLKLISGLLRDDEKSLLANIQVEAPP